MASYQYMSYYCGLVYHIGIIFITIQGDCFLQSYTLSKCLCDIVQFLINSVFIMTSFVQGHHRFFVIVIVTGECAILILQKLRL